MRSAGPSTCLENWGALLCRDLYRETYRDHLHTLPQANEDNALRQLLTIICRCEKFIFKCCSLFCLLLKYYKWIFLCIPLSQFLFFIKGDFNCCGLWKSIPKLHVHYQGPDKNLNATHEFGSTPLYCRIQTTDRVHRGASRTE